MTGHSLSFLAGPGVSLIGLGAIVLLMRWVFAPPASGPSAPPEPADFGLLVPVATACSAPDADRIRERLHRAGIRCTLTGTDDGVLVLVFRADADRAGAAVRG